MDLEELIKKWDDLGLMEGISEELKFNTAISYEKAANTLISNYETFDTIDINRSFLTTAIFPVIYRICKTGLVIKNIPDLIQKFEQFLIDNRQIIIETEIRPLVDAEAEICRIFSEDYCQWIKDNPEMDPIRYIPKHKL